MTQEQNEDGKACKRLFQRRKGEIPAEICAFTQHSLTTKDKTRRNKESKSGFFYQSLYFFLSRSARTKMDRIFVDHYEEPITRLTNFVSMYVYVCVCINQLS